MEHSKGNKAEKWSIIRLFLALIIGALINLLNHLCSYQSLAGDCFMVIVLMGVFPLLVFFKKAHPLRFFIFTTVSMFMLKIVYLNALHYPIYPQSLLNTLPGETPKEFEILMADDHYKRPYNRTEEYLHGHKYGWQLTTTRFGVAENGEICTVPEYAVKDFFKSYMPKEQLTTKSESFLSGVKDGTQAAIELIKNYSKSKLKKADQ